MEITMEYYLVISTIMFFAGIYGFMTRRNMLAVLISIELILNSVDINFVCLLAKFFTLILCRLLYTEEFMAYR